MSSPSISMDLMPYASPRIVSLSWLAVWRWIAVPIEYPLFSMT
jgi:hypothetical protein